MMKRLIAFAVALIVAGSLASGRDIYDELKVKRVTAPAIGTCSQSVNFTGTIQRKGSAILKNNYSATTAPTVNDDANDGYNPGSMWFDNTADILYVCTDNTVAAAAWSDMTSAVGNALIAAAVVADNTIIRGDGGSRGTQDSGITVDDSDNMNMNGGAISNVGNVDGVDVSAHVSRHNTGGADAISALAASVITSGTLAHERGGLEADVSAYSGLLKISGGSTSQAVANTDYAAATHASRHLSGGADSIKLDDLATPDDNTDLNATTTYHGLLPKLDNNATSFLNGQGGWSVPAGGGDVSKVGTPANDQVGVWTGDGTIEGTVNFTYDGSNIQFTGDLGSTGTRITKGWFTDLQVTNAIAGSVTGNSATVSVADETTDTTCFPVFVTTATGSQAVKSGGGLSLNSNTGVLTATGFAGALTGNVTGNCTGSSGSCTGQAATVATITGLAPDTATTAATQGNITTCANLTTIGTVTSGGLSTGAVLGGVTMTLGSDADGDIYYRSSNVLTRLGKGTALQHLRMNAGATAPEWATPAVEVDGSSPLTADWDTGNFSIKTLVEVTAHTGTGNITAAECRGGVTTNTGAGGAVVLTLPDAEIGMSILVVLTVAQDVDINPQDGEQILVLTDSAGDAISSDATIGSSVTLIAVSATQWMPVGQNGTWTDVD